jgi:hypothetical protein
MVAWHTEYYSSQCKRLKAPSITGRVAVAQENTELDF